MAARTTEQFQSSPLLVFPELFLVGYPPRDLLQRPWFIERVQKAVEDLAKTSCIYPQTGILFGAPWPTGKTTGKGLYNSAILTYQGQIRVAQHKSLLPTYDVFDEDRYFDPAPEVLSDLEQLVDQLLVHAWCLQTASANRLDLDLGR